MLLGTEGDLRVFGRIQLPGLGSCLEDKIKLEIKVEIHENWYFLILSSSSRCLMHLLLQLTSTSFFVSQCRGSANPDMKHETCNKMGEQQLLNLVMVVDIGK